MSLSINLKGCGLEDGILEEVRPEAEEKLESLWQGSCGFTGWLRQPLMMEESPEMAEIEKAAEEIRQKSACFLVLGVGGSYIGAKAVIDLLGKHTDDMEVLFAGYHFSARYIRELFRKLEGKDLCLCVISKSGSTAETMVAYGVFREYLIDRYGSEEAADRTYVITENRSNPLYDLAVADGAHLFDLAKDIGGRYSVLTAVGLLPAAVAGLDIRRIVSGAARIADREYFCEKGLDYAIVRQHFYQSGKYIEVFEFFDPYAAFFGEWLKQLFGESEGKEKKGIFPATLMFSRDLHSMGQYLQQGTECLFETLITAREEADEDVRIPDNMIPPFAGKTMKQLNACAVSGVYDAHVKAGIPVIHIEVDRFDAETVGELIYYFETQCAVSALLSGVNPFDQPGVEAYKSEMRSYVRKLDSK